MQTQIPKLTIPIRASHDKRVARRIQKLGCVLQYRNMPFKGLSIFLISILSPHSTDR